MAAWALTCILFMLLPGPDMALVTGWAVGSGTRAAWLSVLGIISSFLIYAALCLSGVAALVYASSSLISIMQVLGGGVIFSILPLLHYGPKGSLTHLNQLAGSVLRSPPGFSATCLTPSR